MGLWSWLFPSADDRVAAARKALQAGRPDQARLELLELDHADAPALMLEAENALALKNLEHAVQLARTGDDVRAAEHLQLAEDFHHGGHEEAFRETRRELREIRGERDAAEERRKAAEKARLLQVDPLGVSGGPSFLDPQVDPEAFDPDREEREQRLALHVEGYPASLRSTAGPLGPEFGQAILDLHEGRAGDALQRLIALPDDAPLVQWERAKAAWGLQDPVGAISALRRFANLAGGHHLVGNEHSGVFLASALATTGDPDGAVRVLREVLAAPKPPPSASFLLAQLLAAKKAYAEADTLLVKLVKEHPKQSEIYTLLARVRVAGGQRIQAMRALEASLEAVCCTPGKCGSQAPDLDTHRLLATLYLEDGIEQERALDLARTAASLARQTTWEDAYLGALVARTLQSPDAPELARRLIAATPTDTPLHDRAARLLEA